MRYPQTAQGIFHRRRNRFIAEVYIHGMVYQVHVKNTGRLKELLRPGVKVMLQISDNPNRNTKYSLIMVEKKGSWINIDSYAPNFVAYEAARKGKISELGPVQILKREVMYRNSRFDLYFETDETQGFIEVKGVTLENDGIALFPDAPTTRGTKHIYELIHAVAAGYRCALLFVVQMNGVNAFKPNREMDEAFARAVAEAKRCGVEIWVYDTVVTPNTIVLGKALPYIIDE